MNQSESSIFWKWSVYHFLKALIIIWKTSFKKHMILLELLYKKKEKIRIDFLIDETDVDSYFFHNFLDVYVVRNRVLRLSKGLFREAYSIKVFTFDPTYCVSKLQTYGWITPHKERIFVYSENLKLIKKLYDILSKSIFIPYSIPIFVKTPQQISLFLHFFKDFQNSNSCLSRFGIRFPEICFEKFNNFELSSHIYINIKKLDYLLKNQQFLIDYIQKIQLISW